MAFTASVASAAAVAGGILVAAAPAHADSAGCLREVNIAADGLNTGEGKLAKLVCKARETDSISMLKCIEALDGIKGVTQREADSACFEATLTVVRP